MTEAGFRSSGNRHAVSNVVGVLCCWRTINSDASRGKGSDPDCQLKPGVRSVPMIAVTGFSEYDARRRLQRVSSRAP